MKTNLIKLVCGFVLLEAVAVAPAQSILYQLQGTISGTYNGTDFANQSFTLSAIGDPANAQTLDIYGDGSVIITALGVIDVYGFNSPLAGPTFSVSGVGSETANPGYFGFAVVDGNTTFGAGDNNSGDWVDFSSPDLNGYNFGPQASIPVSMDSSPSQFYANNLPGEYWSNLSYSDVTFSATLTEAPEPSSVSMLALSAMGGLLIFRRRK